MSREGLVCVPVPEFQGVSHTLRLSNGCAWNLRAAESARSWLEEFVRILRLRPGYQEGIPNITFGRGALGGDWFGQSAGPVESHLLDDPRGEGWFTHDLTLMRVWHCPPGSDRIGQLLNTRERSVELLMMRQALHPIFETVMDTGGLPLHAALVAHEGRGILLAGTGGSGKSTCCRRLPSQWDVLCDDEALVVPVRARGYLAHPLPTWNDLILRHLDRTWDVSSHVPVHAAIFIRQADTDSIEALGRGEASARLFHASEQACFRHMQSLSADSSRKLRLRMFANACDIAAAVPVFALRVSRLGRFWRCIETVLNCRS